MHYVRQIRRHKAASDVTLKVETLKFSKSKSFIENGLISMVDIIKAQFVKTQLLTAYYIAFRRNLRQNSRTRASEMTPEMTQKIFFGMFHYSNMKIQVIRYQNLHSPKFSYLTREGVSAPPLSLPSPRLPYGWSDHKFIQLASPRIWHS